MATVVEPNLPQPRRPRRAGVSLTEPPRVTATGPGPGPLATVTVTVIGPRVGGPQSAG